MPESSFLITIARILGSKKVPLAGAAILVAGYVATTVSPEGSERNAAIAASSGIVMLFIYFFFHNINSFPRTLRNVMAIIILLISSILLVVQALAAYEFVDAVLEANEKIDIVEPGSEPGNESTLQTPAYHGSPDSTPECQLIFDAGSSGTRLYAYENSNGELEEVYSDPIEIDIGVSWALEKKRCGGSRCTDEDIKKVVADLIREFHRKKTDHCKGGIAAVNLYATAGMRLAAQEQGRAAIIETYKKLNAEILETFAAFGDEYSSLTEHSISARTLAGQEEGIYTWLTINTLKNNHTKLDGIFEIGGASLQLTYPCGDDDQECLNNAVKVSYNNSTVNLFSYSWLGLGRVEAFRIYNVEKGFPCNPAVDSENKSPFDFDQCLASMAESFTENAEREFILRDPLNYNAHGSKGGEIIVSIPEGTEFHAAGGIGYENLDTLKLGAAEICDQPVADLIAHKEDAFKSIKHTPKRLLISQCFAFLYYDSLLGSIPGLNLTSNERKIDGVKVGWTLGAAICEQTSCIDKKDLSCRWNKDLSCGSAAPID